ncbi:hypothetical protein F5B18DRAFT_635361 [Nemania serpens]|nr:hypothetical protein F5B18DRAFT_635361 [Nemania serpens]
MVGTYKRVGFKKCLTIHYLAKILIQISHISYISRYQVKSTNIPLAYMQYIYFGFLVWVGTVSI